MDWLIYKDLRMKTNFDEISGALVAPSSETSVSNLGNLFRRSQTEMKGGDHKAL